MTPEEMADIHASAMVHSVAWGVPTLTGFLKARGAVFVSHPNAFALGRVIADEAELLTVAVHPDAQGSGLGRSCLNAFEAKAIARGATRAFLEVSAQNDPAIKLYRTSGYSETGRRPAYYTDAQGQKSDALLMSKPLVLA